MMASDEPIVTDYIRNADGTITYVRRPLVELLEEMEKEKTNEEKTD